MSIIRPQVPQNLTTNQGTVILPCDSITGFAPAGNISLEPQSFSPGKTNSIKVFQTVAGTAAYVRQAGYNYNFSDLETVELIVKIENRLNLSSIRISLENSGSNYFYCFLPFQYNEYINNHGWYKIRVHKKEFLAQGSPLWTSPFTGIGIRVSGQAGVLASAIIDKVSYNVKGIPKVLFTYDDGWQSVYDNAFPLHQQYKMPATMWVVSKFAQSNDPNYMRKDKITELYNAGWDIGNHSDGHDRYTQMTVPELKESFRTCRDILHSWGFHRSADHACYPAGEFGDDLIVALKEIGVKTARTTVVDTTAMPPDNIYKIKTFALGSTTTIQSVYDIIDKTIETGVSLHFMLHRVEATPIDPIPDICFPTANLKKTLEYLASKNVDVVTINQWYEQLHNPRFK